MSPIGMYANRLAVAELGSGPLSGGVPCMFLCLIEKVC